MDVVKRKPAPKKFERSNDKQTNSDRKSTDNLVNKPKPQGSSANKVWKDNAPA
jgi:hypothetical protein